MEQLTIAVSKGRIFQDALPLLARAGIAPLDDPDASRKLIVETNQPDVKLVIVRAADVPTYVEHGAADLGIAGKDVLLEHGGDGVYEPLDLRIARCRMMVAGPAPTAVEGAEAETRSAAQRLRIATKYVATTRRYYAAKATQVEIIKFYGSMELAPLVGLADRIVDLVDTGNTLRANGLAPLEHIADISARLIVNKASLKMKHRQIKGFMGRMAEAVGDAMAAEAGSPQEPRRA
jgi:ATP phosphoribosyltransferase